MTKFKLFQRYFIIFYLFGLSPFISFHEHNKIWPNVFFHLPRMLSISSLIFITYNFYHQMLLANNMIMSYLLMTFSIYWAFFENIYLSSTFRVTFQNYCITVKSFEKTWHIECPLEDLEKKFRRKFVIQIVVILNGLLVKMFVHSHFGVTSTQDFALTMAFFYKSIHLLYATMYIDLIQHFLICVCDRIKLELRKYKTDQTKWQTGVQEKIHMLYQIKSIHFNLWHLTQRVNKQFGFFLTAVPVDTVSTVSNSFYWMFILLTASYPKDVLRKNFSFCLFLFFCLVISVHCVDVSHTKIHK